MKLIQFSRNSSVVESALLSIAIMRCGVPRTVNYIFHRVFYLSGDLR
jgi:hypothetical protein